MDRLPREAALAGCIVITNREGAAKYDEDVPLPSQFKFSIFDVNKIYTLLKECCSKHDDHVKQMKEYKDWILGQEKLMEICVDRFMDKIVARRRGNNE